jgi:hypothetical protein
LVPQGDKGGSIIAGKYLQNRSSNLLFAGTRARIGNWAYGVRTRTRTGTRTGTEPGKGTGTRTRTRTGDGTRTRTRPGAGAGTWTGTGNKLTRRACQAVDREAEG